MVVQAPDVLGDIMLDASASPKHRIDLAKALDAFAANGPESAPAADRFQITINLGSDVLHFDKSIATDANDIDPFIDIDATPQGLLAAIAMNKPRTTAVVSLFERLNRGRPPPTRKAQEPSPAQKLLDWLQHWSKPTVSARDICIYGPNAIRDRQRAIDSAEILVKTAGSSPSRRGGTTCMSGKLFESP